MNSFLIKNIGDRSISVYFENIISPEINLNIHEIVERINKDKKSWLVDVVPTYNSFSVVFDINLTKSQEVKNYISEVLISKKNQRVETGEIRDQLFICGCTHVSHIKT